jgi:hypothetical protein
LAARPALASSPDDSALLALEEQFFEQKDLADSYNGEIHRLSTVCRVEGRRLYDKALAIEVQTGKFRAAEERWGLVGEMPESIECVRLERLQDAHHAKMEHLVKQMWAMPANTPEGRRAKVLVALNLLPDDWRVVDEHADWGFGRLGSC